MGIEFPEDIPIIRGRLESHNITGLSDSAVANQWQNFSSRFEAGWLDPSSYWLDLFDDWLES